MIPTPNLDPAGSSLSRSALVRRCNVCNIINAVDLDGTPERWAEMQCKDHTVWHVAEETAIKLWNEEGGKCDHAKLIEELLAAERNMRGALKYIVTDNIANAADMRYRAGRALESLSD